MANQIKDIINVEVRDGLTYNVKTGKEISSKLLKSHLKKHEFRIVNVADNNLATGLAIRTYEKTAIKFLQDLKNYSENSDDVKTQIDISNKLFRFEDVVSTGLEILIDFSTSEFEIIGLDNTIKTLVDYFQKNINKESNFFSVFGLNTLLRSMAFEYFVSGNAFPAEIWDSVDIDGKKYKLPVAVKLLNPANIEIDNAEFSDFGQKLIFSFGGNKRFKSKTNVFDLFENRKPNTDSPIFKEELKDFKDPKFSGKIFFELNNDLVSHIKRKARDYDVWGIPYLTKLAQAVTYKQKLWQLDLNTIDGLMNFITIFRIGSPDKDSKFHIPSPSRLAAFKGLIDNPQASTQLVWPHDIDMITAGPSGEVLSFSDKYTEANRAIIQGLGVPPILIDGTGTATAAWTTVIALNKKLEIVRDVLKNYIEHLIVKIAKENNIESELTGKESLEWSPSDLRNDVAIKQLLLAYYDRGLLPIQTAHTKGGYNHEDMVELKIKERDEEIEDLFSRPDIPFSPQTQDKTPGRPSDVTDTVNEDEKEKRQNTESDIKFAKSSDLISDKYREDVMGLFDKLENDIDGLKKKSGNQIDNIVLIAFVRLNQIADTFANFDDEINDTEFNNKLILFHENHLDRLRNFVMSNINKLAIKKIGDEKALIISGIIAQAKKRAELFVKESLKNAELAKTLSKKRQEGMSGAIVHTNKLTTCDFCKEIDGNFLTLSQLFTTFPSHPHQGFTLEFVEEDPIVAGKHKNKIVKQNPKNKSKKL